LPDDKESTFLYDCFLIVFIVLQMNVLGKCQMTNDKKTPTHEHFKDHFGTIAAWLAGISPHFLFPLFMSAVENLTLFLQQRPRPAADAVVAARRPHTHHQSRKKVVFGNFFPNCFFFILFTWHLPQIENSLSSLSILVQGGWRHS
jgi:hypothetical protein